MDFSIIEKAGLRPIDLAEIVDVSRASVSFWVRGIHGPNMNKPYAKRLQQTMDALARWVELGKLPKPNTSRADVVARIKAFLDKQD